MFFARQPMRQLFQPRRNDQLDKSLPAKKGRTHRRHRGITYWPPPFGAGRRRTEPRQIRSPTGAGQFKPPSMPFAAAGKSGRSRPRPKTLTRRTTVTGSRAASGSAPVLGSLAPGEPTCAKAGINSHGTKPLRPETPHSRLAPPCLRRRTKTFRRIATKFRRRTRSLRHRPKLSGRMPKPSRRRRKVIGRMPKPFGRRRTRLGRRPGRAGIRPDAFGIRPAGFGIRPDGFGIRPTGFGIRRSRAGIRRRGLGLRPQGINLRRQRMGTGRPGGNLGLAASRRRPPGAAARFRRVNFQKRGARCLPLLGGEGRGEDGRQTKLVCVRRPPSS
jgi:hypothetical protein